MEPVDRPIRYVGESDYRLRHWLGFLAQFSEFISLAILSLVGIHRTLLVMWKVEAFGIICMVAGSILHFSIAVCYLLTYWYEFKQRVYKRYENIPFRDRRGGFYFVLCIGAAFYMTTGFVIIHIVGIFKAIANPAEDGVIHLILLAGDVNLVRHFATKVMLVGSGRDGKYSLFGVFPLLLSFELFSQKRGWSLQVQEQPRPGLNVVSAVPDERPVATPNTPLM